MADISMINELLEKYNISEKDVAFQAFNSELVYAVYLTLKRKGIKPSQLAEKMGVDKSQVSRWLSGVQFMSSETIFHLGKILGEDIFNPDFLNQKEPIYSHPKIVPARRSRNTVTRIYKNRSSEYHFDLKINQ